MHSLYVLKMKIFPYILALLAGMCSQGHAETNERVAESGDYLILSSDEGTGFSRWKIYRLEKEMKIQLPDYHSEMNVIGRSQSEIINALKSPSIFRRNQETQVTVEIIKKDEIEERIKGGEIPIVLHGEQEIKICWVSKGTTVREFIDSLQESYPKNRFKFGINLSARSESVDLPDGKWEEIELIAHDIIFVAIPFTHINQNQPAQVNPCNPPENPRTT